MVDPEEQRARLEKEFAETESQVQRLEKLLASQFAEKAPQNVVEKERQKLAEYQDTLSKISDQLDALTNSN
jgi:valyl-tRNA synthetase